MEFRAQIKYYSQAKKIATCRGAPPDPNRLTNRFAEDHAITAS